MKLIYKLLLIFWAVTAASAPAATLDEIQERGELVIGVSIFAPWTFYDGDGGLSGHEIDIGNSIAEDLGVNARFEVYNFDEVFDALTNGEIDMIAAGVAMTPERARLFNFSIPYLSTGVNIAIGPGMTGEPDAIADFNAPEISVAVVEDTLAARVAARVLDQANIMPFATASGAEGSVLVGRAQAYVASVPETRIFALRHSDRISIPVDEPLVSGVSGFVLRTEDDQLLHFLNSWVHMRRADGFLGDRHHRYFETLDWAVDMVEQ